VYGDPLRLARKERRKEGRRATFTLRLPFRPQMGHGIGVTAFSCRSLGGDAGKKGAPGFIISSRGRKKSLEPRGSGLDSLHDEQPTKNCFGQGESDCLIETKHCDGRKRC